MDRTSHTVRAYLMRVANAQTTTVAPRVQDVSLTLTQEILRLLQALVQVAMGLNAPLTVNAGPGMFALAALVCVQMDSSAMEQECIVLREFVAPTNSTTRPVLDNQTEEAARLQISA